MKTVFLAATLGGKLQEVNDLIISNTYAPFI